MLEVLNEKHFPPLSPDWGHRTISNILINGLVLPSMTVFMHFLNRTRVLGRENLSHIEPPWILMSNHITLLDDLFLGPTIFYPKCLKHYRYIPYHAPEQRNFYKKPLIAWFLRQTKSIPLIRGKGVYQEGVNKIIEAVKSGGILHIYPEGTRTRTGDLGPAKGGIGRIVYESGAPVIPMYHQGLERILPIGAGIPRFGREIRVAIGEPLHFDEELTLPNIPATWKRIAERIMQGIAEQKLRMETTWGPRQIVVKLPRKARSQAQVDSLPL
ncbi:MAG: 1-acyl-sn-glycerol-3-phosphate acyltransferase [Calditrichaeota bacterium]|nr:1-acyl-sn-glycerol-3-phosphate acyltransferase [Calditrichota bacterium]